MKKIKFTEAQITFILKQAEDGTAVAEVCRKAGISDATFYNWRKKYAGLMPSKMKRLRQLEEENAKLKRIVADLSLDKAMMQDVLAKKAPPYWLANRTQQPHFSLFPLKQKTPAASTGFSCRIYNVLVPYRHPR